MRNALKPGLLLLLLTGTLISRSQRHYKPHSVLSSGAWYKIAVRETGVYRMDMGFLKSLGLPTSIPSDQLQVYGRREAMLPEVNNTPRTDDLEEKSVQTVDGGDGNLNGPYYVLFFAPRPGQWVLDAATKQFKHQKNRYSDRLVLLYCP